MANEDIKIKYLKLVQMIIVQVSIIIILICSLKNKYRRSQIPYKITLDREKVKNNHYFLII